MLDGVTLFPAEFAARYRRLGWWEDRPLFDPADPALFLLSGGTTGIPTGSRTSTWCPHCSSGGSTTRRSPSTTCPRCG
jgi:non-ribosomal peptide synthetase component E (peptide arylation enzyme)